MNKRLPKTLRDLAEQGEGLPRALYMDELEALCKLLKSGMLRPLPGVHVTIQDVEENRDICRTVWTVTVEDKVRITVKSKLWSACFSYSPPPMLPNIHTTYAELRPS